MWIIQVFRYHIFTEPQCNRARNGIHHDWQAITLESWNTICSRRKKVVILSNLNDFGQYKWWRVWWCGVCVCVCAHACVRSVSLACGNATTEVNSGFDIIHPSGDSLTQNTLSRLGLGFSPPLSFCSSKGRLARTQGFGCFRGQSLNQNDGG